MKNYAFFANKEKRIERLEHLDEEKKIFANLFRKT